MLKIVFSVTYYLELHNAIAIYFITFLNECHIGCLNIIGHHHPLFGDKIN
jgi:hypothetical protein